MTVSASIDPARLIEEQLAQASPDLLRELLTTFVNTLMSAEADAVCGAAYGVTSPDRTNRRNGYRPREFDTRTGTLELEIPKLRTGTYFPEWLLERRKRAERALTSVVATCYLLGVSTRRMDRLVQSLGITTLSKSQVSEMAKDLDVQVEQFRSRRLDDAGPFTFVAADALVLKVREGGRVVPVHCLVATGVDADGHRQVLGVQVTTSEDGAGWLAFFRDLVARGLKGVRMVTSDAHAGLVAAITATLPGATWQRCRTHYAANLMSATPKSSWPWVKALLHSVYDQPDKAAVNDQFDRIVDALAGKLPAVADHLETARADILAFTAFPKEIWRQIWSNSAALRVRELRRELDADPDRSRATTAAPTTVAPMEACADVVALKSSLETLTSMKLAEDGAPAMKAAIADVKTNLELAEAAASEVLQPSVEQVKTALAALQTAASGLTCYRALPRELTEALRNPPAGQLSPTTRPVPP